MQLGRLDQAIEAVAGPDIDAFEQVQLFEDADVAGRRLAVEADLRAVLARERPDDRVLGEEYGGAAAFRRGRDCPPRRSGAAC